MIRMLRPLALVFALVAVLGFVSAATAAEAKGKVKTVSADKNEFVVNADGKSMTFHAGKDCKVTVNGKASKLADLQADDTVDITYDKVADRMTATSIVATRK